MLPIRLFIVDDHELVRYAMESWIEQDSLTVDAGRMRPIEVVGTADAGQPALAQIAEKRPDVVLVDFQLPDMLGSEIIAQLRAQGFAPQQLPMLVMTGMENAPVRAILTAGANGYISKSESSSTVLAAIRHIAAEPDDLWLNPTEAKKMLNAERALATTGITTAEKNVLRLLHFTNEEIAELLVISRGTVKNHLNNVYQKLGIGSREAAAEFAMKIGLLSRIIP
jgi:DNA-binding NarL/FixJ family response regulator